MAKVHAAITPELQALIAAQQTSCGFGVPHYRYIGQRDLIFKWAEARGPQKLAQYQQDHNTASIDGLPTPLSARASHPS